MYAMQPITYTTGSEIQAPYRAPIQPGNIESGVGFGPASRLAGECLARHVTLPGMCWGKFSSQNTRSVDQYDPSVYGALETQYALASTPFNTLNQTGNASNTLSYAQSSAMQPPAVSSASAAAVSSAQSSHIENMDKQAKAAEREVKKAQKEAEKQRKEAERQQRAAEKQAKKAQKASSKSGESCSKDGSCSTCG